MKKEKEKTGTIGQQIRNLRIARKLTIKQLGLLSGFPETTADSRMAQYEVGTRTPCDEVLNKIADVLCVSRKCFYDADLTDREQMFHILFDLESEYGIEPVINKGRCYLDCGGSEEFTQIFKEWIEKKNLLNDSDFKMWKDAWPKESDYNKTAAERKIMQLEEQIKELRESIS